MLPDDCATNPYASHLPILRSLEPRRVLEFGPGLYSTALFLSMPSVTKLVSVEHDSGWFERLYKTFRDDRWELRLSRSLPARSALQDFDLILIDNGHEASQRVETIRHVLSGNHPRVVIHDAEEAAYRDAIGDADHWLYKGAEPWTAVVQAS